MGRNQAWCKCRGNLRDFHWNIVHASYKDPWGRKKCDFFLGNFPLPGFQSPHRMTYLTYLGSEAEKVDSPSCTKQKNVPSSKSIFSWLLQQPCTCYYTHHPENWTTERNWHSFTTIPTFFLKNRYNQTKIIHPQKTTLPPPKKTVLSSIPMFLCFAQRKWTPWPRQDKLGRTAFHNAVAAGCDELAKGLLEEKVGRGLQLSFKRKPKLLVCVEVFPFLLEAVSGSKLWGCTPFWKGTSYKPWFHVSFQVRVWRE